MQHDALRDPEFDDETPPWRRGEMAVVADPDACDGDPDDELPDTIPEPRPLEAPPESDAGGPSEVAGDVPRH